MTFGEKLKYFLKVKGHNQAKFAEIIGVEPGTVSRWVRNLAEPEPERLAAIAKALNVEIEELLNPMSTEPAEISNAIKLVMQELEHKTVNSKSADNALSKMLLGFIKRLDNLELEYKEVFEGLRKQEQPTFTLDGASFSLSDIGDKLKSLKSHHRDAVLDLLFHGAENEASARNPLDHGAPSKLKPNKK